METRIVCRPCQIAEYLAEEAFCLEEDFSAGVRMWHDKCKQVNCDCQVKPREGKLLSFLRLLLAAGRCRAMLRVR